MVAERRNKMNDYMKIAKRMICEINKSDINLTKQEKDLVSFIDRQTAITYEQYQELDKIHEKSLGNDWMRFIKENG